MEIEGCDGDAGEEWWWRSLRSSWKEEEVDVLRLGQHSSQRSEVDRGPAGVLLKKIWRRRSHRETSHRPSEKTSLPSPPSCLPPSTHHAVCQHKAFNLLTSGGRAGQTS